MASFLYLSTSNCLFQRPPPSLFPASAISPSSSSSSYKPLHPRRRRRSRLCVATPSSPAAPTPAVEESQEAEEGSSSSPSESSFSWRDHWYPVSLIEDLDPRVPTPFQLLNRDLVLWKDPNSGDWVALDDRCPHRLAPLSVNYFFCPRSLLCFCYIGLFELNLDVRCVCVGGEDRRDRLLAVLVSRVVL